jgi:hypothetical protein
MGLFYPFFWRIETCAIDVCFATGCSNGPFFSPLIETTLDALSMRFMTKFAIHSNQLGSSFWKCFFSQHLKLLLAEFASKLDWREQ